MVPVIVFDADDTLWDCQTRYDEAEARFDEILARFGDASEISSRLFDIEARNMPEYGYGAKAVALSMIEAALKIGGESITSAELQLVLTNARSLLHIPTDPLPGVEATLQSVRARGYRMILLTKGDLLDQQNKLHRSGLRHFFDRVVILSEKDEQAYLDLCTREGIAPEDLVMVGNSFKSDILPVIKAGGRGIFIPFKTMWKYETVEPFEHPRVVRIDSITSLTDVLDSWH